jgi:hypothetical protein
MHAGFWGVEAGACPSLDLSFAVAGLETTRIDTALDQLAAVAIGMTLACAPE